MVVQADSLRLLVFILAPRWGPALLLVTYAYYRDCADGPARVREDEVSAVS
ncbi:MAG TPA: hypothetical protein VFY86_15525 [Nocardioides sp.]|jgi:hypothetical protein|nr:hypothetical protein [uncultured Nocardioides sp.]HEX5987934.1 hypothetical protein [Nocardioides sp.]